MDCIKVIVDPLADKSGLTELGKKVVPEKLASGEARKAKKAAIKALENGHLDARGRNDDFTLAGKVVLITGASAGIGEACARGG